MPTSMIRFRPSALRLVLAAGLAVACIAVDVSAAHAQSASCQRLEATLANLDRNSEFRNVGAATREARAVGRQVQRDESAYIRDGCNDDARAGRQLSPQCRALARDITRGREDYARLVSSVETGNAVAQQREALLQEIARFGCNSRARVVREPRRERGSLFDQLFEAFGSGGQEDEWGDGAGGFREDGWDPWGNYHTVRTLCVRKSDGFYWPISYSTLTDYVANDAEQCRAMCPGLDVDLYYYDNPGQEPEQMINMWGEPYSALPNAFRFRTEFDKEATCQPAVTYGSINIQQTAAGQSRAMIEYDGATFPLPVRDPRRQAQVTQVAVTTDTFVDVPLPRRRPAAPGEEPPPTPVTVAANSSASDPTRIVHFGDRRVRIVGPVTPYAQAGAAGI